MLMEVLPLTLINSKSRTNGNTFTKGTLTVSGTGATTLGGSLECHWTTTTAAILHQV